MNVLADRHLANLESMPAAPFSLTFFDPDHGLPAQATAFDALIVRTVTPLNRQTLPEKGELRFVGTATSGFDHLDTQWLEELGLTWAHAGGCNAQAVAEYVVTVMYRWAKKRNRDITAIKTGIVGCGFTGSRVYEILQRLGIMCVVYDPPRAEREPGFRSAPVEELLSCDVLTFHTPLVKTGPHPTTHLCGKTWLSSGFGLVINAARGGVVDETSLALAHQAGRVEDYILDVWENEPLFSDALAQNALIATPHIAGYSREGKRRASEMILSRMASFFGSPPPQFAENPAARDLPGSRQQPEAFGDFLWETSSIQEYDHELRNLIGLSKPDKSSLFLKLRAEFPLRTEFRTLARAHHGSGNIPEELSVFLTPR